MSDDDKPMLSPEEEATVDAIVDDIIAKGEIPVGASRADIRRSTIRHRYGSSFEFVPYYKRPEYKDKKESTES